MGKIFQKIGMGFRRFMQGRYGNDKLNTVILIVGLIVSLLQLLMPIPTAQAVLRSSMLPQPVRML